MANVTQAYVDALWKAYAQGVTKVRFPDGKEVNYPSGADMLARIRTMQAEVDAAASGETQPVGRFATFRRR